ncbi:MAG: cation acetate symporter [Armatimonadaceae bacterium]
MEGMIPLLFVIAVTLATIGLGVYATQQSRTASDFFVAGRSVNVFWNASAISGEYLSAASFMGVAGLIMKHGYDALWYPVGYAVGYLFLLLFIAGPLRRFGAYTIPDFAEGRFDSPNFRKIAVIFVLCIGFFYTMPQMKAAGVTMQTIMGWPYWVGIVVVGGVITFNVALGGMKGITLVQAFQYWAKAFATSLPIFVLFAVFGGYGNNLGEIATNRAEVPRFTQDTPLTLPGSDKAPANTLTLSPVEQTRLLFPNGGTVKLNGEDMTLTPGEALSYVPTSVSSAPGNGAVKLEFLSKTEVVFLEGTAVPNAQPNEKWIQPYGTLTGKHGYPLLYTYSLIIALVCGTAGLPHILVRFYTNPDGRTAKRTTFWVMVLLGVFYVFTPMWGTMGRADIPQLLVTGKTDTAVIALPMMLENKLLGQILSGITSAGAFAAFMSTFSGLLVSMSGAFAHDIFGKILKPESSAEERLRAFQVASVVVGAVSIGLGLLVEGFDIAMLVGWAFAIAAASYFPLLLLGSWWRGLTATGAASGMLVGGLLSLGAIIVFMLASKKQILLTVSPLTLGLLEQPAIWAVPLSLTIMAVVSLATKKQIPADIEQKMLRLHAPEEMGYSKNYIDH